jgi:DNA-binding winged helix-turn-helix (wHTH) protein
MAPRSVDMPKRYRFEDFLVDVRSGELTRSGVKVKLPDQPFRVLTALLVAEGQVVTREELRNQIWSNGTFVDFGHSLNLDIAKVRAALGDDAEHPRYIETIPRRGYRFLVPVEPELRDSRLAQHQISSRISTVIKPSAFFIVLIAAGIFLLSARPIGNSAPRTMRLAVLPFTNLTGDAQQDYLGEGLTQELITTLGGLSPERTSRATSESMKSGAN